MDTETETDTDTTKMLTDAASTNTNRNTSDNDNNNNATATRTTLMPGFFTLTRQRHTSVSKYEHAPAACCTQQYYGCNIGVLIYACIYN